MNEENKAVELTDDELEQVSGGGNRTVSELISCEGDCNGTKKSTCKVLVCPHNRKTRQTGSM